MLAAQRNVRRPKNNVSAAEAAMKPTVNLTGPWARRMIDGGDSDTSLRAACGRGTDRPIYQGGRLSSPSGRRWRSAMHSGALHLTRLQVKQDVGNAYANLRPRGPAASASREAVRAAQVAFEGTREEAKLGARTTLDVLDAEQDLLDAQANLISANADVVIAAYAVLAAIGELTAPI